jgi:hypothetical protein
MKRFSIKTANTLDPQSVACPKCDTQFTFYRSSTPHFDECGFELYQLNCGKCETPLVGIVDPADNKLLLSATV